MLLAEFCTRLACGLACMIVCTSPRAVSAAYLRTLMLVAMGLTVLGALAGPSLPGSAGPILVAAALGAFVGSVLCTLGWGNVGRAVAALLAGLTGAALVALAGSAGMRGRVNVLVDLADAVTSAWLLGSMLAAMLLGHAYLVSPTMSIEPLRRFVVLVSLGLAARSLVAGGDVVWRAPVWSGASDAQSADAVWWSLLAARWLVGLFGSGLVAWMVWETTKIRATQSATGILYVGVILAFFGELISLLVARSGLVI